MLAVCASSRIGRERKVPCQKSEASLQKKLIIDADPGVGDALAIALALVSPELDVLAVTATAGVVSGEKATQNVQTLVETLDPEKWPRIGCSDLPIPDSTFDSVGGRTRPIDLHGAGGLGTLSAPASSLQHLKPSAKLLTEMVREYPQEITLLTLGPLTNVYRAMELTPDFLALLGGLVCYGGTHFGPGDVSPVAEYNVHADCEAARNVLTAHATKTLVPLDVASRFVFTFDELRKLDFTRSGKFGELFESLVSFSLRSHLARLGMEGVSLTEIVALFAASKPELFQREMFPLDVETQGELTRGMTLIDRRLRRESTPNIELITGFDPHVLERELRQHFV